MKIKYYILFVLLAVLMSSCKYFKFKDANPDEDEIARVGTTVLYKMDLKGLHQPNMSEEDSIKVVNNFIENWAKRQIILQKAAFNLSATEEADLQDMVKKYKEDLYIYSYKAALVSQNIDSIISDDEIKNYYTANNHIFHLNEDLLRYRLISYQFNDRKASKMKELLKKNDSTSISELLQGNYMFQTIQTNDSLWINYADFINKYPFTTAIDKEQLLQSNTTREIRQGSINHFIIIKSVLRRGDTAPLQFIKEDVVKMLIHQKKLKYLQDLDNKLIQEAIQNKTYEKF